MGRLTESALEAEIQQLETLSLSAMRLCWVKHLGGRPPKHQSLELLRRRLAYELQIKAYGGLKVGTIRRLRQLYNAFQAQPKFSPLRHRDLKVGSALNREWKGQVHNVLVLNDAFEYRGESYRSLSEVAGAITGRKISGLRFFGFQG